MASIDERIVAMSFENSKFEAGVAQTMASLEKLNSQLSRMGGNVTLEAPMSALDKLKVKLGLVGSETSGFSDIDKAANKVTLNGPATALDKLKAKLGLVGADSSAGFSDIERAGNKVTLDAPMSALDKLKAKIGLVGVNAADGFNEIEKAGNKVDLKGVNDAIDQTNSHFGVLQGAASVAFGNIASMAALRGGQVVKSMSLGPVIAGFQEYATNLNSIQTILANTQASGAGLKDVNAALWELNKYSDQTIYNFSEMAKNIGTFTAAGVGLKPATAAIKGIANLAALSGSNAQQASMAMYQLSQAIASGKVGLQDWNSVVNAGMGGTVFQRALAQTAVTMGTIKDGALSIEGPMKNVKIEGQSFRDSIMAKPGQQSWLTSDVLTKTLAQFTGDLSDAQLKAQGFSEEQIKAIQATAKTAKAAATEVKTISQAWDVAKETLGSGWSKTFQTIFGDFGESKKLFTSFSNYMNGVINSSANARNKVLDDWKALGGRSNLIQGLKNAWADFLAIIKPIKDAFRDIFPAKTGKDLADLTDKFEKFTEKLKLGPAEAENLRRTFAGFFALLDIGKHIVGEIIRVIADLFGTAGKGAGGFLAFTGSIGDFLKAVDQALVKGGALRGFFNGLESVLKIPISLISGLASLLGGLFNKTDSKGAKQFGSDMKQVGVDLKPVEKIIDGVANAWHKLLAFISQAASSSTGVLGKIVGQVKSFFSTLKDSLAHADWGKVFTALQTGFLAGIFITLKKALGGDKGIGFSIVKDLNLDTLNGALKILTGNLTALQRNIQAKTLLMIAAAIGILAIGVLALSQIDGKALDKAMAAVAIGLGELVGALALLSKVSKGGAFLTMPILAGSLILLATAVTILAGAVAIFSRISWEGIAKGLVGVAGSLTGVALAMKLMPLNMAVTAASLLPLAIALNILAMAVTQFAKLSWKELIKGLLGVEGALAGIGISMNSFGPETLLIGPGLIAVAFAMNLLAGAVMAFGHMNLGQIGKGILGVAGSLVAIGLSMDTIPPGLGLKAAGLVVLSLAIAGISVSVGVLGRMKLETLAKGIGALGAMLVVLAKGLTFMDGTLPGAAALMATAVAMTLLGPALVVLGSLDVLTIVKGLAAMAGVLLTLSLVGKLASTGLAALGIALLPLAGAMALVALGVYALAKALALLSDQGVKGITVLIAAITAFTAALPGIVINFLKGLVDILEGLAKIAPQVVDALSKILASIIQVVINEAPKLAVAIGVLVTQFLQVLVDNGPKIFAAGATLLIQLLDGLIQKIPVIAPKVALVIVEFLNALAAHAKDIVAAGVRVVVSFIQGLANGAVQLVGAAANLVIKFLTGIASKMPDMVKAGADLIISWLRGIGNNGPRVIKEAVVTIGKFLWSIGQEIPKLAIKGAETVINFVNGIADAIRQKKIMQRMMDAAWNLAWAIGEGFINGLGDLAAKVWKKVKEVFMAPINWVKDQLDIFSPSRVTRYFGQMVAEGFAVGIDDNAANSVTSAKNMVGAVVEAVNNLPSDLGGSIDIQPTITPVLDLSAVEKDAPKLQDLTNVTPITAAASYDAAAAISSEKSSVDAVAAAQAAQAVPTLNFEQNNYSPESLSDIEIYRQTRNQLSQVKSALGLR